MSCVSSEMQEWYNHSREDFNKELESDIVSTVCVFQVPKSLSSAKPEAYTPQLVGLGPYHHLSPHLTGMQRVKLEFVKRIQKEVLDLSVTGIAEKLHNSYLELCVRTCYHKFINMEAKMLFWIMIVDALFLFYQLCQHSVDNYFQKSPTFLRGLADGTGKKLADASILRDIMMLENQIPIFFVEQVLRVACEQVDAKTIIEDIFPLMLVGFCKALSPLKDTLECPADKALKSAHLLDLLYSMVMEETKIEVGESDVRNEEETGCAESASIVEEKCVIDMSALQKLFPDEDVIDGMEKVVNFIANSNLPILKTIKRPAGILQDLIDNKDELWPANKSSEKKGDPAEEKVLIPTASSLHKAGVIFRKTKYIKDLKFDPKTCTFYLPTLKLGINSEVVIRNLVAYEAMAISGPLEFARFVEMMDGLINTVKDVKLLKKHGIITDRLKNVEVMHMFNGMSKCIEVNSDSKVDKEIKKVNDFHKAAPSVKIRKTMDQYVYGFWKLLALGSTVLLFLLMGLETFCSAYNCTSLVRK